MFHAIRIITRIMKRAPKHKENDEEIAGDELYKMCEREAYKDLFNYIRTDIIPNKMIIQVTSLVTKLESFMLPGRVTVLQDFTRKHIRMKLESELGNSVDIFPDDKGKPLMVPESVSLRDIVLENQTL